MTLKSRATKIIDVGRVRVRLEWLGYRLVRYGWVFPLAFWVRWVGGGRRPALQFVHGGAFMRPWCCLLWRIDTALRPGQ